MTVRIEKVNSARTCRICSKPVSPKAQLCQTCSRKINLKVNPTVKAAVFGPVTIPIHDAPASSSEVTSLKRQVETLQATINQALQRIDVLTKLAVSRSRD